MPQRPTIYILDSFSLIYQVFHAIPLMTSPSGQPTIAVFGIFRDLLNLLKTRKVNRIRKIRTQLRRFRRASR